MAHSESEGVELLAVLARFHERALNEPDLPAAFDGLCASLRRGYGAGGGMVLLRDSSTCPWLAPLPSEAESSPAWLRAAMARWDLASQSDWGTLGLESLSSGRIPATAPLMHRGRFVGIFALEIERPPFMLLARVAHEITSVRAAHEACRRASSFDPLTGLLNRRGWDDHAQRWAVLAERNGWPVGLLVLDIDGFKAINEAHGYREGDRILRTVAARLRGAVRESDPVARWGGDEFAILLPQADATAVELVVQRLAGAISAPDSSSHATVSVGCSVSPAGAWTTFHDLWARAEHALRAAKIRVSHPIRTDSR